MSEKDIQQGYDIGYSDGLAHGKLEGSDETEERIIKPLDEFAENTDYPEVEWTLHNLKDAIKGDQE